MAPRVSVCMITYNHERYIAQAVTSVLAQEAPFPIELVVGDDASTDRTRAILESFAHEHPARVRLLSSDRNLGMMPNFIRTLQRCSAQYVALCEGDDYWVDPHKLQKQALYLDLNPECALSFHNAYLEEEEGESTLFHTRYPGSSFGAREILRRWLIPTASAVFRNPGFADVPAYLRDATHGDLALFMLLAEGGSLDYCEDVMSVYRLHPGGVTRGFAGVEFNRRQVTFLEELDRHYDGRYRDAVADRLAALHRSTAIHHVETSDRLEAWRAVRRSWRTAAPATARGMRETFQVGVGIVSPSAYRLARAIVRRGQ